MKKDMHTNDLLPILREFKGKKSILRLISDELISCTIGDIQLNSHTLQNSIPFLQILDGNNKGGVIFLSNIKALRLE
jgi:hypothetical protein